MWSAINKKDIALLILRVIPASTMLIFHGLPKIMAGQEKWEKIGLSMGNLGIDFYPILWGLAASLIESLCALFIVLGLWTRTNSILLALTMLVATISHITAGDGFSIASHAIELMTIFTVIFLMGPGKYSVDKR